MAASGRKKERDYTLPPSRPANPRGSPLHQVLALRGAIQHYDWGSRTALAELLGRPVPSERPEAELWLGAHPRGPADVRVGDRWERLDALLERAPEALLGAAPLARFGARLPFLLKVLAVERPLSLQAHPDAAQARAGFARDRAEGGAAGLYADPHAKPELVCALGSFTALCGFQPLGAVRARFGALGLEALLPAGDDDATVLASFLRGWLERADAESEAALGRVLEAAARAAARDRACADVVALEREHPGDPGVVAPLLLHRIDLAPGEALFLPPGELHCYLAGTAVELMASSDNVLRGGLTAKPVDAGELLRIARFAPRRPPAFRAEPRTAGEHVWRTPAEEFELSILDAAPGASVPVGRRRGAEILWCVEGDVRVQAAADPEGLALARGESCLVPAGAGPYRVGGAGRVFRAALPEEAEG